MAAMATLTGKIGLDARKVMDSRISGSSNSMARMGDLGELELTGEDGGCNG